MIYTDNGIYSAIKKYWYALQHGCDPQKHYAKWKNPDTKCPTLYDSVYMRYTE